MSIEIKNNLITLYHGSPNAILKPKFGKGKEYNDYGNGLYLTAFPELAKEWAVASSDNAMDGYLFKLEFSLEGLKILDFDNENILVWISELMSHRPADKSERYRRYAQIFIDKYKLNTDEYDIIKGWRANSSYFRVVKLFLRNDLDVSLIKKSFHLGDLGIQYFIKSKKAFERLEKKYLPIEIVPYEKYHSKYKKRDDKARQELEKIVESKENTLRDVFDNYIRELI